MSKNYRNREHGKQQIRQEVDNTMNDTVKDINDTVNDIEESAKQAEMESISQSDELEKSIEVIKALEKEKEELKDQLLRLAADMENLRKRTAIDVDKAKNYAISDFARDLLPVADNLQRALDEMEKASKGEMPESVKNIISGIKLTQKDLENAFTRNNVVKQQSVGKIFNPNFDKVVQERVDNTVPSGTVLEEWQAAYTIKDRVLREAVVVVAKNEQQSD